MGYISGVIHGPLEEGRLELLLVLYFVPAVLNSLFTLLWLSTPSISFRSCSFHALVFGDHARARVLHFYSYAEWNLFFFICDSNKFLKVLVLSKHEMCHKCLSDHFVYFEGTMMF